ncbi:MAG: bifunctional phosphoribosyl-AMP cyclohydrolase/phosphoribosyl-ATP diphosphatase HisIE, partial [Butyrivibrio sp.]|nr:bifunctional phosphoribosyl-AMP cyclohydrolase/phosphoribosyl-ATP diphosphatase HisIE [Butyrivibrio sp.]
ILYFVLPSDDGLHEEAINELRLACRAVDIPVYAAGGIKRAEDVKKYLYAGARAALIETGDESNLAMLTEVTNRFGKEKVGAVLNGNRDEALKLIKENGSEVLVSEGGVTDGLCSVVMTSEADAALLSDEACGGICAASFSDAEYDFMSLKMKLKAEGVKVNTFESAIPFSEFKLNVDGLIPVVVQDYATDEVLMLAYMNEEAYRLTLETGKMTYYSRSRSEIWVKGLTSGHYQYVMSLRLDCDNDTVLARVRQVGAACHTGAHSCFFKELAARDVQRTNPLKVFNEVMAVILDRKANPKEGSYTNYLFDKGIDKILKKVGEEATEIVIAAKNPDTVEIKYEIADFLYHVMVLMAEKGLDWEEVTEELANR